MQIADSITVDELWSMQERMSEPLVKGVVDVARRLIREIVAEKVHG